MTRWTEVARAGDGDDYAAAYAERFRRLAAGGADVHGEAGMVTRLRPLDPTHHTPPPQVLDAGCGTGRVAVRLHELGYEVVGCDVDASMVEQARAEAPGLDWRVADLAALDLGETFDVVLLAGNVVPLLDDGTLDQTCHRVAGHLAPEGLLVCGFGTDADHLPAGCPVTDLDTFAAAARAAGLEEVARWGTWTGDPWSDTGGYVVLLLGLAG